MKKLLLAVSILVAILGIFFTLKFGFLKVEDVKINYQPHFKALNVARITLIEPSKFGGMQIKWVQPFGINPNYKVTLYRVTAENEEKEIGKFSPDICIYHDFGGSIDCCYKTEVNGNGPPSYYCFNKNNTAKNQYSFEVERLLKKVEKVTVKKNIYGSNQISWYQNTTKWRNFVLNYKVFKSYDLDGPWTEIGMTCFGKFVDYNILNGDKYYYRVVPYVVDIFSENLFIDKKFKL